MLLGEAILALQRYFMSGSVFFPVLQQINHLLLWKRMIQLQVFLFEKNVPTAVLDMRSLNQTFGSTTPLYVIMSQDDIMPSLQQLFSRLKPSDAHWLLFMGNTSANVEELLGTMDIPLDCEFLVAVESHGALGFTEAYRVHPTQPLVTSQWGDWSLRDGLRPPVLGLPSRRSDLQGITFVAAAINAPPRQDVVKDSEGNINVTGFYVDFCREISKELNFSLVIVHSENNAYGIEETDGSWNGAVGMTLAGTINLTVLPLTITKARSRVVDYTVPVHADWVSMHIQSRMESKGSWTTYLSPFSSNLWLFMASWIAFTACYISIVNLLQPDRDSRSIKDILLWTWSIYCVQAITCSPRSCSLHAVLWVSRIAALIILAVFNANFTSYLAVRSTVLPFSDLHGLLKDGTYGFGPVANGSTIDVFRTGDEVMRRVYQKYLAPNLRTLPINDVEGFKRVCRGGFVYMTFRQDARAPCDLTLIPANSIIETTAFILPKGSPYRRLINHTIQEMKRKGLFSRMYSRWVQFEHFSKSLPVRSVTVQDVQFLLLIYACGVLLGAIMLAVEIFTSRRHTT